MVQTKRTEGVSSDTTTIREVADFYKVSTRTIRYYEEIGILHPKQKENGQRVFGKKERIRLKLIFRGKKYGFQLAEIKEMIELFDRDRTGRKQLECTIVYGKEKVREVTERMDELDMIRGEMKALINDFQSRILEMEGEDK